MRGYKEEGLFSKSYYLETKTDKTIDVVCPHCGMTVQSKPR